MGSTRLAATVSLRGLRVLVRPEAERMRGQEALQAPRETLLYLPAIVQDRSRPDYLVTVDVDPNSSQYSQVSQLEAHPRVAKPVSQTPESSQSSASLPVLQVHEAECVHSIRLAAHLIQLSSEQASLSWHHLSVSVLSMHQDNQDQVWILTCDDASLLSFVDCYQLLILSPPGCVDR